MNKVRYLCYELWLFCIIIISFHVWKTWKPTIYFKASSLAEKWIAIKNSFLAGCADAIIVINLAWLLWWFHHVFWEVSKCSFCIICIKITETINAFFHALYLNLWRCQSVKLSNIEPFSNKWHLNHFHALNF